jgi:hypothetical protein
LKFNDKKYKFQIQIKNLLLQQSSNILDTIQDENFGSRFLISCTARFNGENGKFEYEIDKTQIQDLNKFEDIMENNISFIRNLLSEEKDNRYKLYLSI